MSDEFSDCIQEAYSPTCEDITVRATTVDIALKHVRELGREELFQSLFRNGGDLPTDLLKHLSR